MGHNLFTMANTEQKQTEQHRERQVGSLAESVRHHPVLVPYWFFVVNTTQTYNQENSSDFWILKLDSGKLKMCRKKVFILLFIERFFQFLIN